MKKPALPLWYFWTNAAVQYDRLVWWGCTPNYHDLLYHQLILNLVQHWQQLRLSWTDFPTKHIQQDNLWNQGIPELGNLCHGAFYAKFVNRLLLHIYIYIYMYVCILLIVDTMILKLKSWFKSSLPTVKSWSTGQRVGLRESHHFRTHLEMHNFNF